MGNAIISRRGGGDYATIKFENYGSLEHTTPSVLSEGRSSLVGTSTDSYAFFAGGVRSSTVDVYDINLTRSMAASLKEAKNALAGANLEDYAIFAGGYCVSTASRPTTVDLYANGKFEFTVFKDSKYKFQNMSSEVTVNSNMVTVSIPQPATGYIKVKNTTI